jgi:hypothetical protein
MLIIQDYEFNLYLRVTTEYLHVSQPGPFVAACHVHSSQPKPLPVSIGNK